jgi:catechol 2,3-dioxygenase-like lactoylglutathione lyase family enzyme
VKPRISVVNIAVADLERSRRFYEGLGFVARPESNATVVFFQLDWSWLAIFTRPALARIAGTATEPAQAASFCLSHFVTRPEDVDAVIAAAVEHGGTVAIQPADGPHGRIGYFADPDGYRWEVACSPNWLELAE